MILFSLFFFGFFCSFVGSITPSMLNMTALKISLEAGKKEANKYALAVSLVSIPQVFIAVILTKYIADNPSILQTLEKAGIIIFVLLSYYFYKESKKTKVEGLKENNTNPFLTGITLSFLNMFAIPFFCGIVILLDAFSLFNYKPIPVLFFGLGAVIGTFYILFLYGKFAKIIQEKTGKLTKDINLILSFLTAFVAVFTLIKQLI